ncbi:hypothetical protein ABZ757_28050 [Streptomyces albidoflavus]
MNRVIKSCSLMGAAAILLAGAGIASAAPGSVPSDAKPSGYVPDGFFKPAESTVVMRSGGETPLPEQPGEIGPAASEYALKNVSGPGEVCGTTKLQKTSGAGKTTLVMTVSKSVSAELSAEVSVDAKFVSGKLGFKVTSTYGVEDQTRYEVPKGKYGYIEAYPLYDMWTFNVYKDGKNKGASWAMKPVGVCFNQWTE